MNWVVQSEEQNLSLKSQCCCGVGVTSQALPVFVAQPWPRKLELNGLLNLHCFLPSCCGVGLKACGYIKAEKSNCIYLCVSGVTKDLRRSWSAILVRLIRARCT